MAKASPLQEQWLKAGLVKKSKVSEVAREQVKAWHGKGPAALNEIQLEAERARLRRPSGTAPSPRGNATPA